MPILNDSMMEAHALPQTSFGYSATRIDELDASEYTTVDLVVDTSTSVGGYVKEMEASIKEIINACKKTPRADNLMVRLIVFNSTMEEIHGYKLLGNCNLDDYDGVLKCGGMTALYDASENAISSAVDYAKSLTENNYSVNSIVFIITDGVNNRSANGPHAVKNAIESARVKEAVDSMITVLIGVGVGGYAEVSRCLSEFKDEAGIDQYVETKDASADTLAKIANFVSKSVSAQSQSLFSGTPSNSVSLSI